MKTELCPSEITKKLFYKSIAGPVSELCRSKTDKMDLAAWLMIPEHENWITEVSLVSEKLEIGFTGFNISSCEICYYYQRHYLKWDLHLKEGYRRLSSFLSNFFCMEQLASLFGQAKSVAPGGVE